MSEHVEQSTVIVVDDDADTRIMLGEILREEGFGVELASNGPAALDLLRRRTSPPALILLDLIMPGMTGKQFWSTLRADPAIAEIPVVVLSASDQAAADFGTADVAAYLPKPFRYQRLVGLVADHCR